MTVKDTLELMDWKSIENGAMHQIKDAEMQLSIGALLLDAAQIKIKKLGGQTHAEEEAESKKQKEDQATKTA
jgi:hypothetical protein